MSPSVAAADTHPGHSASLKQKPQVPDKSSSAVEQEMLVLNTIRCFAADLCQEGGHPGTVMGAAAVGVALWKYILRYNPANPQWFGRDRFVLSVGHACLLQYLMLHFSGYEGWTLEEIRKYHSFSTEHMAAGHPEIEYPGIEASTGPLGQGIANAVGMAMAGKQVEARFNKDEYSVTGGRIWCMTGDGCLQEGVGQEAISIAGHLGLDNLILIYDNNRVTVDGSIDQCFTDDTSAKLKAMGWEVIEVSDGSNDLAAIVAALELAKHTRGKPTLVNIRTIIGLGSQKQNTGSVHGAALGPDDVAYVKTQLGFNPDDKFVCSETVYDFFKDCPAKGQKLEDEYNTRMKEYSQKYPEDAKELKRRQEGKLREGWEESIPKKGDLPKDAIPTRKASGIMVQALVPNDETFVAGSADLMESTFVNFKNQHQFQNPEKGLGDYKGRQIMWGIREFAMVACGNGMAVYQKGMFIPIMSTFFMFWLYAAPAARMASLQRLRFIGIATHDGLGLGEDGPTHQPISLANFYRGLPNTNFIRPADAEEVVGAYLLALSDANAPTIISLSRQAVPLLSGTDRSKVSKGAYIVYGPQESETPDVTLISTGCEVYRAIEVAKKLVSNSQQKIRVVSMPSQKHFDLQSKEYKKKIIPSDKSLVVAIEAWGSLSWARYAHAGCHMHTFGLSAPQQVLYEHFGFGVDNLTNIIEKYQKDLKGEIPGVGQFEELLNGFMEGKHYAGKLDMYGNKA